MTIYERKLLEALQVLVGERGPGGKRALRVEEFDKLFQPANVTTMRRIAEITALAAQQGVAINSIVVNLATVNTDVDDVQAAVQTFTTTIQADFDSLNIDVAAANTAVTQAQTIKDEVTTLRNETGTFNTAAGAARTASETARDQAQTSATNAQGSATAAAGDATSASSSATNSSNSATAAQGHAVSASASMDDAVDAAALSASNASAAATNATAAAASSSDASIEATAASTERVAAETARTAAQSARDAAVTAKDSAETSAATATTQAGISTTAATNSGSSATSSASSAAAASSSASDAGTSATAAQTAQTAAETARSGAEASETAAASSETSATASQAAASTSATTSATSATAAGTSATEAGTSATEAATSASAASTSATTAATSATEAETSATAASASSTTATTAATSAGVARDQSVTARDAADSAAALAGDRLAVTAAITSQGVSVLRDQFLENLSGNYWTRETAQGALTRPDNTLFSIGRDWQFVLTLGQIDGMMTQSDRDNWRGAENATQYLVEVDFTLVSGPLGPVSLWFDWVNDAGTVHRVDQDFADNVVGLLVVGQAMTASFLVERPSGYSGVFSFNRAYVWAAEPSSSGAAKTIKFHRISIRPANNAERRVVSIEASVSAESIARASADTALATQITEVETDLDGVTASVTTQATAISTLEGNAAATLAFRVKAGTSGAQIELVAADDPAGSVSAARIDADEIILTGSVTADLISVTELSAITATLGTFQSAASGERIVIEGDRISVFDSGNQLRVRIGRLA